MTDALVPTADVCARLGVTRQRVGVLGRAGRLGPRERVGAGYAYRASAIETFVTARARAQALRTNLERDLTESKA